jgi:hypothetical protein
MEGLSVFEWLFFAFGVFTKKLNYELIQGQILDQVRKIKPRK